jgi:PT repeat
MQCSYHIVSTIAIMCEGTFEAINTEEMERKVAPTSQPTSHPTGQPTSQPTSQPTTQPTSQPT